MGDSYKAATQRSTGRRESEDELHEMVPLTRDTTAGDMTDQATRIPQGVDIERIQSPNDGKSLQPLKSNITFQRSQSLPHIQAPRLTPRARFLSGVAPKVTLDRMRRMSERTFSAIGENDENQERGNWDNPIEFFLSCLGYAVGLGNVWRFPYLAFKNGGGAFLIPYFIMLVGCGLPILLAELTIGQYSSQGPLTVWKLAPLFKGLGVSMVVASCVCAIYYNMITGWALYYLYLSMRSVLPWECCDYTTWATDACVELMAPNSTSSCPARIGNHSQHHSFENKSNVKYAADEFFHNSVLHLSEGIHEIGGMNMELVMALAAAWLIVFCVLAKGIKSIGKSVYFTSTFPYLVLLALFVNAVKEPGALEGIAFFLTPKWEKLLDAEVWGDAASQIFYSTGVCMGGTITLASYNQFNNNLYRDAVVVAAGNSLTSIFSGMVVFSILGFMANRLGTTLEEVATEGPGLTFITYPQAVVMFPASPVWSALFFLMLVVLALSTMFPTTENIATSLIDQFPDTLRPYKFWVTMATCFVLFLGGLPLTTSGGMYILQVMDRYAVGYALLGLGFVEIMVIAWRYGADRLIDNIEAMTGTRPWRIWYYVWKFVTPLLLVFAIVFTIVASQPLKYGDYVFPGEWKMIGGVCTLITVMPIFVFMMFRVPYVWRRSTTDATGLYKLAHIIKADSGTSKDWHPALSKYQFAGVTHDDDDVFGV